MSKSNEQGRAEQAVGVPEDPKIKLAMSRIRHKILIISNKGGVGKSTLAVNLAVALGLQQQRVGLLDIDIHGPSVPKMLGINAEEMPMQIAEDRIIPAEVYGIKVVSMGFILGGADTPVIWRGPIKANVIRQFLGDVEWGTLDYLVVDSPPGTGDEPLTIFQLIPRLDGAIIITTPQEVALLDSRKAVRFAQRVGVPVLGIVENMGWLDCPHCGKRIDLFKQGNGKLAAEQLGVDFLGSLPFDLPMVEAGDRGRPAVLDAERIRGGEVILNIARTIMQKLSK